MAADSANFAMVHLVTNVGDGSPGIFFLPRQARHWPGQGKQSHLQNSNTGASSRVIERGG